MSNVQLAQDLYEAFNRGDIATVLGMFDPSGSPWIGGEAITQNLFMKIPSDFDGFTVHPKEFHDAGDTVVVELRYSGTGKATGKPLDAQVCHVLKFRDDKLTSFQQFVDTAQLHEVMGRR